jgi:Protein of unknown function (DUF2442)
MPTYEITDVDVVGPYQLRLRFADGLTGTVDVSFVREYGGVFQALRDPDCFKLVKVDHELGTVVWPSGADLAPDVLYKKVKVRG